jgi:hypothetical protein
MAENFEQLRERWIGWLKGDPVQSIWKQIYGMIWDDATFRSINETRSYTTGGSSLSQNAMVARFIDSSYVAGQSIALARLVDRRKDVISLCRLIAEIKEHRTLITRAAYLNIANLPYYYEPICDAWFARVLEASKDGVSFSHEPTSGPNAWSVADRLHRTFDRLSGVSKTQRKPEDCLALPIVDKLSDWLADPTIQRILRVRHKFVAHAADAASRSAAQHLPGGITLNDVATAHRIVFRVAAAISGTILYDDGHSTPVPTPQHDQFEFWDHGFIPTNKLPALHAFWRSYEEERVIWTESLIADLLGAEIAN